MAIQTSMTRQRTDGTAIASLVMAMLSFLIGPLGFIPAIICGHVAHLRLRKDTSLAGSGLATAGLIIGYGFLALYITAVVWAVLFWHSYFSALNH
jgi:Domain of unknown function (DUF4190)